MSAGHLDGLILPMRCGRPTKAGAPCRAWRMPWDPGFPIPADYRPPACVAHATPSERRAYLNLVDVGGRQWHAAYNAQPVRCHEWPVTAAQRMRANAARMWRDPGEGESLAWELLADWQDDRCAICGTSHSEHLDHDHQTGLVRGWLCQSCNVSEGFDASPDGRYGRYRAKNPASILGLSICYRNRFS